MKNTYTCLLLVLLVYQSALAQATQSWPYLKQGTFAVGFKTMKVKGSKGDNLEIGIWYPGQAGGNLMALRDYIIAGREKPGLADSGALNEYKDIIELPFLYHLDKIPAAEFERVVSTPFFAYKNAPMQQGKFPLLVTFCGPAGYPETFEFLASHGIVVACVSGHLPDVTNDTFLYVHATEILEEFSNLMKQQPYVDTNHIAAFGHGWGIQPSFYLAMRTRSIKLLINLDGGVFGPRSKTQLSPDYKPARLTIPMLHIVSAETRAEDDQQQFNALTNSRYKVMLDNNIAHHDFTGYGRVVDGGLHKRGDASPLVEKTYAAVHDIMLYFLKNGKLDSSVVNPDIFKTQFVNAGN